MNREFISLRFAVSLGHEDHEEPQSAQRNIGTKIYRFLNRRADQIRRDKDTNQVAAEGSRCVLESLE